MSDRLSKTIMTATLFVALSWAIGVSGPTLPSMFAWVFAVEGFVLGALIWTLRSR